jgi:hypothetical protein
MTDKPIDRFKRGMETIINNRLNADMIRAHKILTSQLSRQPTRDEITTYWIYEQEKIVNLQSGNKEQKMAVFKAVLRKFWEARDRMEAKQ